MTSNHGYATASGQRGVALIVSLIMLTMMSMLAISSVQDTVSYTQITNNTQFRKSAEAAAQVAIEQAIVDQDTTLADTEYPFSSFNYQIPIGNLTWDVEVTPVYLGVAAGGTAPGTSLLLPGLTSAPDTDHWDLVAVIDDSDTNTAVEVHQGYVSLSP